MEGGGGIAPYLALCLEMEGLRLETLEKVQQGKISLFFKHGRDFPLVAYTNSEKCHFIVCRIHNLNAICESQKIEVRNNLT